MDFKRNWQYSENNCEFCTMNIIWAKNWKTDGLLHLIEIDYVPLHSYHIDDLGPPLRTARSYKHVCVVVAAFSRYVWYYPTKTSN